MTTLRTTSSPAPALISLALQGHPPPDWADVVIVPLPRGGPDSPRHWADQIFSIGAAPRPVQALLALREVVVGLIGVDRAKPDVFAVREVVGEEALIVTRESHLTFRVGVGVDPAAGLLRVTTAVWLHGWRGRLYFGPVSVLHDPVTRAMMRSAVRRCAESVLAGDSAA